VILCIIIGMVSLISFDNYESRARNTLGAVCALEAAIGARSWVPSSVLDVYRAIENGKDWEHSERLCLRIVRPTLVQRIIDLVARFFGFGINPTRLAFNSLKETLQQRVIDGQRRDAQDYFHSLAESETFRDKPLSVLRDQFIGDSVRRTLSLGVDLCPVPDTPDNRSRRTDHLMNYLFRKNRRQLLPEPVLRTIFIAGDSNATLDLCAHAARSGRHVRNISGHPDVFSIDKQSGHWIVEISRRGGIAVEPEGPVQPVDFRIQFRFSGDEEANPLRIVRTVTAAAS
jgi:hypothetical protein